jgi:glutathionylspermidine synthase
MKPIRIIQRPNWQAHIRAHAYQADVLSDREQTYWVEALPEPFALQFSRAEEAAIAQATETLWELCVEFLDWFFTETEAGSVDERLAQLKIPAPYWPAIKQSWERTEPTEDLALSTRFDLAMNDRGQIKLLEINGETPLLGGETVYQWNWYVNYINQYQQSEYPLPPDAEQFNQFWEQIAAQWRRIAEAYDLRQTGIAFLVDEELEEDLEMAMQLIQILHDEVDPAIYAQVVYLQAVEDEDGNEIQAGLGLDQAGYFIDAADQRIAVLWKMYDWADIQNDVAQAGSTAALVEQLESGRTKVIEPLWKQVLSNKGTMAFLWEYSKNSPDREYLLATYFDDDLSVEATQLSFNMHVKKPLLGCEGAGISIETGMGTLESRPDLGHGETGCIIQAYVELPQANGYHYMIGSWSVDGVAAGMIMRGDTSRITGRNCLIIPHIISDIE